MVTSLKGGARILLAREPFRPELVPTAASNRLSLRFFRLYYLFQTPHALEYLRQTLES